MFCVPSRKALQLINEGYLGFWLATLKQIGDVFQKVSQGHSKIYRGGSCAELDLYGLGPRYSQVTTSHLVTCQDESLCGAKDTEAS